jgi:hypothetical protein
VSRLQRLFLLSTCLVSFDTREHLAEQYLLHQGDPLRYLLAKENGQDPGPLHPSVRQVMDDRYLTHLWGWSREELEQYLKNQPRERVLDVKRRMTHVLSLIQPMLQFEKSGKQYQPRGIHHTLTKILPAIQIT